MAAQLGGRRAAGRGHRGQSACRRPPHAPAEARLLAQPEQHAAEVAGGEGIAGAHRFDDVDGQCGNLLAAAVPVSAQCALMASFLIDQDVRVRHDAGGVRPRRWCRTRARLRPCQQARRRPGWPVRCSTERSRPAQRAARQLTSKLMVRPFRGAVRTASMQFQAFGGEGGRDSAEVDQGRAFQQAGDHRDWPAWPRPMADAALPCR